MNGTTHKLAAEALPSRKFRRLLISVLAITAFLVLSFIYLQMNPLILFTEFYYVIDLLNEMFPPSFELLWSQSGLWASVGETFAMAFLGTLFGALFALILAFLAARNTAPSQKLCRPLRILLGAQRAAPDFAVMLVIVVSVGFGPFAGTIALVIGSTGIFGKLFADAIEQVDTGVVESLAAAGASRLQVIRFGILPEVSPSFISNTLYLFEINVGSAIALGVFGGGGLGFELHVANATLNYPHMLAYITVIAVLMVLVEKVSDYFRNRLFASGGVLT